MNAAAFTALQDEVAKLREQVRLLRSALFVSDAEDGRPLFARLRCHSIQLADPEGDDDVLAQIHADESGGRLEIWGRGDGVVAEVGVGPHGAGEVIISDRTPHQRIVHGVDESGIAYSVVFRTDGKPGALMKGMKDSAAVTATGADGKVRACLVANASDFGEVFLAGGEHQRVAIKGAEAGGCIVFSGPGKDVKSVLGIGPDGPNLMLIRGEGAPCATIIVSPEQSIMSLNASIDHPPTVRLFASETVAFIDVMHRKDGAAFSAIAVPQGTTLEMSNATGAVAAIFDTVENAGRLRINNAAGQTGASMGAIGTGGYFFLHPIGPDGPLHPGFAAEATPAGSTLLMHHAGRPLIHLTGTEAHTAIVVHAATEGQPYLQLSATPETQFFAIMQEENTALASIHAKPDGASLVINSELGIRRAVLGNCDDGGALVLCWGGHPGVTGAATEKGGMLAIHDPEGRVADRLPRPKSDDGGDGDEDGEDYPE